MHKGAVLFALIVVFLNVLKSNAESPSTPVFPTVYSANFLLSLPYADIREPIQYWYDSENALQRVDYYGGLDSYIWSSWTNLTYQIFPMVNKTACLFIPGPVQDQLQTIFPDMTNFKYKGTDDCSYDVTLTDRVRNPKSWTQPKMVSSQCDVWEYIEQDGNKTNTYTYYQDGTSKSPIRYRMMGYDSLFGSHYDEYIVDYGNIFPGPFDLSVFDPPNNNSVVCTPFPGVPGREKIVGWHTRNPMNEIVRFHPHGEKPINKLFSDFISHFDKKYISVGEHSSRQRVFHNNLRLINSVNRQHKGYTLAINHHADWSHSEYLSLLNTQRPPVENNGAIRNHIRTHSVGDVPSSLDWRDLGAVTAVKDQGVCGSCWSFGAAQTIEGAVFVKYGTLVRLSSQELVDCSWYSGNTGCDGGLDFQGYQWMMKENNGYIATEQSYPYLMANGLCHADRAESTVRITGYVNVSSANDESILQEALYSQGPISVSIDASHEAFSFYSSGVYYDKDCKNGVSDLDHTVLLVGYGIENGQNYWIIKNSWSTHWGDNGYVKMSAQDNNCGVATTPTYVLLDA